jgi:hypothetical protein
MLRLPSGLAARGGPGHRSGDVRRIGRGRDRGVGGVTIQVGLKLAQLGFYVGLSGEGKLAQALRRPP